MDTQLQLLLVEDSQSDAALVVRVLRKAGYDVVYARVETAPAMQAALQRQAWDVVIADYRLPHFDAPAALGLLQQTGLDIPFIVVSGVIGEEAAVETMKAGAHDYVTKGNLARLAPAVARELNDAATRRQRRQAEAALQESESRYRALIQNAPICIHEIDLEGRIISMNPSGLAMMRAADEDEVYGRPYLDTVGEKDRPLVAQLLEQALAGRASAFEFEAATTGSPQYFSSAFVPIMDEAGHVQRLMGISADITERKQAEESLRQLNQAIEQSPVLVMIADSEGTIQYVNPKFSQVTGYSAAEAIGQNPRILKSGEHPQSFYRELWDTISAGREWRGEFHNRKKSGDLYWEMASIAGVKDPDGTITHYVAVKEDITERKRRSEEHVRQERLAAVGQLAAGIAHDFNNVMGVITLYSDSLQNSPHLSDKERRQLQTMNQQAHQAADLTRQILDFSRRSVRQSRPLDLKAFLNEMVKFVERTTPESIQVQFVFSTGDTMVNADPTQIQQAVTNLIINARDAMPHGGALSVSLSRLTLRAGEAPPAADMQPGEWVSLAVVDTGDGIAPDVLPHIFEPFFTTKGVGEGTGLGLAQVYGIVQQHEGYITVDSRVGEGTTFAIYLPAVTATADTAVAQARGDAMHGNGETILLVEDNQVLLEATCATLEMLNYRVLRAQNGREALDVYHAQADQIGLILSDVVMPRMDGIEMVQALQHESPPPKVLLVSGFPRDMDIAPRVKRLIAGWLSKPLDVDQLAQTLRQTLDASP